MEEMMSKKKALRFWRQNKSDLGGTGTRQLVLDEKSYNDGRGRYVFTLKDKPSDWVEIQKLHGDAIDQLIEMLDCATLRDELMVRIDIDGDWYDAGKLDEMLGVLFDLHSNTQYAIDEVHTWIRLAACYFYSNGGANTATPANLVTVRLIRK